MRPFLRSADARLQRVCRLPLPSLRIPLIQSRREGKKFARLPLLLREPVLVSQGKKRASARNDSFRRLTPHSLTLPPALHLSRIPTTVSFSSSAAPAAADLYARYTEGSSRDDGAVTVPCRLRDDAASNSAHDAHHESETCALSLTQTHA